MNQQRETKIIKQNPLKSFSDVRLYVIISSSLAKNLYWKHYRIIQGSADAVQLREKTMSDDEFLALAFEFRKDNLTIQNPFYRK